MPKVISAIEDTDFDVSVYPNPNQGGFKIKISSEYQQYNLSLIDSNGRMVDITRKDNEITLDNTQNGIYLLKINIKGKIITKRIVIEK